MCGGRGTRLATETEKPLVPVGDRPMLGWVLAALQHAERVGRVAAVVSPDTPATRSFARDRVELIETAGDGYVADLGEALNNVERPALTVAADLPTLTGRLVDSLLAQADGTTTVVVPARLKRALGASVDEQPHPDDHAPQTNWLPTGVNVVGDDPDETLQTWDARLAVNVNYPSDVHVAEQLMQLEETP